MNALDPRVIRPDDIGGPRRERSEDRLIVAGIAERIGQHIQRFVQRRFVVDPAQTLHYSRFELDWPDDGLLPRGVKDALRRPRKEVVEELLELVLVLQALLTGLQTRHLRIKIAVRRQDRRRGFGCRAQFQIGVRGALNYLHNTYVVQIYLHYV